MKITPPEPFKPLNLAEAPGRGAPRSTPFMKLSPGGGGGAGAGAGAGAAAPPTRHEQLVEQTRNWVAQTFFGTLLKQMDESPFRSELFSGGRGGQAFSSLYNQQLAERMSRSAGDKLVNSIVRRIEAKAAYQKQEGSGFGVQGSGNTSSAQPDSESRSKVTRRVPVSAAAGRA